MRAGDYPDYAGQVWAEADVDHAAQQMRAVFDLPGHARAVGERAKAHIAREFSYVATGQAIEHRFAEISDG